MRDSKLAQLVYFSNTLPTFELKLRITFDGEITIETGQNDNL